MQIIEILAWPFFISLAIVITAAIFKKAISSKIEKIKYFKAGKGVFEASTALEQDSAKLEDKRQEQALPTTQIENEVVDNSEKSDQPKTKEQWQHEMIVAAVVKKDLKSVKQAYEEITKINRDELEQKKDRILYQKMLFTVGESDAIGELIKSLEDKDVEYEANMGLGYCYAGSEDFNNSMKYYAQAMVLAHNEDEKATSCALMAHSIYRSGNKKEAIDEIIKILSATRLVSAKVTLFEKLADIYENEKDFENRAIAIDKAIELKPNDTSLLFRAGFSYSEADHLELSLFHYGKAKEFNPKDGGVLNNLGVAYENLNLPIKSVENYKEAENVGNTLASANLAYRLIEKGFIKEARSTLAAAEKKENVHPNVNEALAEISRSSKKEEEIEKEKNAEAIKNRRFFLSFADAKFIEGNALRSVAGTWINEEGTVFQIEVVENRIIGNWKIKSISNDTSWKIEGEIFNNSASISVSGKDWVLLLGESDFRDKGRGFLYCNSTGDKIEFFTIYTSDKSKALHKLSRSK